MTAVHRAVSTEVACCWPLPEDGAEASTADTALPDDGVPVADTAGPNPCHIAALVPGWLDQFQTPGDGRVLYCHAPFASNPILIDSAIPSCEAHRGHVEDRFPSTGCDS